MSDLGTTTSDDYLGLIQDEEDARTQALRSSMFQGVQRDPDAFAKASKLSRESGVPVSAVEANPDVFEKRLRFKPNEYDQLLRDAPVTAERLTDPLQASLAHDDLSVLGEIENFWKTTFKGTGESTLLATENALRGGAVGGLDLIKGVGADTLDQARARGMGGIVPDVVGLMPGESQDLSLQIAQNLGIQTESEYREAVTTGSRKFQGAIDAKVFEHLDAIYANKERIAELTPDDLSLLQKGLRAGWMSLVEQGLGVAVTVITKNPSFMLADMTTRSFLSAYGEAREEGLDSGDAATYGALVGAFEYVTERIPANAATEVMTKGWKKALAKFLIGDYLGEHVAELGQTLTAIKYGLDEEWEKATTAEEKKQIVYERAVVTSIATIFATGTQAAVFSGTGYLHRKFAGQQERTQTEQDRLDQLHKVVPESKTRERDPESFREHLAQLQENYGPDERVYIPASDVAEILQGAEGIELNPTLKAIREQLREALPVNADVVIPVTDYAVDIVPGELAEQFREVVRLSADSVSLKEAKQLDPDDPFRAAAVIERAAAAVEKNAEVQVVFDDMVDQLLRTGQVNERVARVNAKIMAAYFATKAERTGRPVEELFAEAGIEVRGEKATVVPPHRYNPDQRFENVVVQVETKDPETGATVTTEVDAQSAWAALHERRSMMSNLMNCLYG